MDAPSQRQAPKRPFEKGEPRCLAELPASARSESRPPPSILPSPPIMLRFDPTNEPPPPRDSATVLFVRPAAPSEADTERAAGGGGTALEVFCVRRHAASPFLGGAVVFPGGKLDAADSECATDGVDERARAFATSPEHALALAVCACRESLEEAGLVPTTPALDDDGVARARAALGSGETLARIFSTTLLGRRLRTSALVPFSRWVTPEAESRRYDARFFVARAPDGQRGQHDTRETTSGVWATPSRMLIAFERGDVLLAPPTLRCLELLRGLSVDEALALAARQALAPICPLFVAGEAPMLVLPGDPYHAIAERRIDGPTRFVLRDGKFVSEEPP